MFDVYCTACSRRRLIFAGQVVAMHNDSAGIHVTYRCWCGELGRWDTGRNASREAGHLAAAA